MHAWSSMHAWLGAGFLALDARRATRAARDDGAEALTVRAFDPVGEDFIAATEETDRRGNLDGVLLGVGRVRRGDDTLEEHRGVQSLKLREDVCEQE
jgi:hypothetical protein